MYSSLFSWYFSLPFRLSLFLSLSLWLDFLFSFFRHIHSSSPLPPSSSPFRDNEGNESFSAAIQLQDGLVKGWALWGEYLQSLFELDSNMTLAHSVLTCYLHACRAQKEAKCRKYLAHIVWLLTHDDSKGSLAEVRGQWSCTSHTDSIRLFDIIEGSLNWADRFQIVLLPPIKNRRKYSGGWGGGGGG